MTTPDMQIAFKIIREAIIDKVWPEIHVFQTLLKILPFKQTKNNSNDSYWKEITLDLIEQSAAEDINTWDWLLRYEEKTGKILSITDVWISKNKESLEKAVLYLKAVFEKPELMNFKIEAIQEIDKHYQILRKASYILPKYYSKTLVEVDDMIEVHIKMYDGKIEGYLEFLHAWCEKKPEREELLANYVTKRFNTEFQTDPKNLIENLSIVSVKKKSDKVAKSLSSELVRLVLSLIPDQNAEKLQLLKNELDRLNSSPIPDRNVEKSQFLQLIEIHAPLKILMEKYLLDPNWVDLKANIDEFYFEQLENLLSIQTYIKEMQKHYLLHQTLISEIENACQIIQKYYPSHSFQNSDRVVNKINAWLNEDWSPFRNIIIKYFSPLKYQQFYHYQWLKKLLIQADFAEQFPDPYKDIDFFNNSNESSLFNLRKLYENMLPEVFNQIEYFIDAPQINERAWIILKSMLIPINLSECDKEDKLYKKFVSLETRYCLINDIRFDLDKKYGLIENLKKGNFKDASKQLRKIATSITMTAKLSIKAKDYLWKLINVSINKNNLNTITKSSQSVAEEIQRLGDFIELMNNVPKEYQSEDFKLLQYHMIMMTMAKKINTQSESATLKKDDNDNLD